MYKNKTSCDIESMGIQPLFTLLCAYVNTLMVPSTITEQDKLVFKM